MNLKELTASLLSPDTFGDSAESTVTGLALDSREVKSGDVFFANRQALATAGTAYIEEAIRAGAIAVFYEADGSEATSATRAALNSDLATVPIMPLPNYRQALGEIASRYYNHPSQALNVIGVTGTNGKTSTAYFIADALTALDCRCGFIGTLGWGFPGELGATAAGTLTTPDVISIHRCLAELRAKGAKAVAMEVSSHGIDQQRIAGVVFETAIFTNLTHDHLHYHKTPENYAATKRRLFEWPGLKQVIVNHDDAFGRELAASCCADGRPVYTYGYLSQFTPSAEQAGIQTIQADLQYADYSGLSAAVTTPWGEGTLSNASLLGAFNISNLLAALTTLNVMQFPFDKTLAVLSKVGKVPGRMQALGGDKGLPRVVIDYAHSPDALEKALRVLKEQCSEDGHLWCVFGCGGDQDESKRAPMGKIAATYSDYIILTNDNTRTENPQRIVEHIQQGLDKAGKAKTVVKLDRAVAIAHAIIQATPHDVILIAGKGHETYQLTGDKVLTFSDEAHAKQALALRLENDKFIFSGVSIDSRTIQPGQLFIAIKGPRFDGHAFVKQAQEKGAIAAIVTHPIEDLTIPQLVSVDTDEALKLIGESKRDSVNIPVIGLTGSCGKTTTKTLLAAILSQAGNTLATQGNLNNHYGVPLTLSKLTDKTDFAVIEMGASAPGEIANLAAIVKPTVALITNAAAAHLAGFGSVEGVAKTKGAIYASLPDDGTAIINADDAQADYWRTVAGERRVITFGLTKAADVTARQIKTNKNTGTVSFTLVAQDAELPIQLALMGRHNVANALAAAAAALAVGVSLATIKAGLESMRAVDKRLVRHRGHANAIVIDDTYNANPLSMRAALTLLAEHPGRRIFVMGEMGELGEAAADYHAEIGKEARRLGMHHLLTQGKLAKQASLAFGEGANHFSDNQALALALRPLLNENTMVLVKGSRSACMEEVVEAIVAVPTREKA